MTKSIAIPQQAANTLWSPSPRQALWDYLERLHIALGLPMPTGTWTIEQLEEQIDLRRHTLHERGIPVPDVPGQASAT